MFLATTDDLQQGLSSKKNKTHMPRGGELHAHPLSGMPTPPSSTSRKNLPTLNLQKVKAAQDEVLNANGTQGNGRVSKATLR